MIKKIKAHVYFIVEKPLKNRGRVNGISKYEEESIPIIEVKSEGKSFVICSPSIHEDGHRYEIIGTNTPLFLNAEKSAKLEGSIIQIHKKYSSCSNNYNPSSGNSSYLTDELKNITKTLKIDNITNKIPNGSRNNTLLAVADSLLYHHYNSKNIEFLKNFLFEINQKICEKPLDEKEVESIWTQATSFMKKIAEGKNSINNNSHNSKGKTNLKSMRIQNQKKNLLFLNILQILIYTNLSLLQKSHFLSHLKMTN